MYRLCRGGNGKDGGGDGFLEHRDDSERGRGSGCRSFVVNRRFVRLKELLNTCRGEIYWIETTGKEKAFLEIMDNLGNEIWLLLFCLLSFAEPAIHSDFSPFGAPPPPPPALEFALSAVMVSRTHLFVGRKLEKRFPSREIVRV